MAGVETGFEWALFLQMVGASTLGVLIGMGILACIKRGLKWIDSE